MNGFEALTLALDRRLINADRISKQELRWLNAYHARVRDEIRPLVDEATKVWLDAATAPMAYTD
jgi:Xaa-Pro aminopeptidase